jgi:tyrosinase
VHFSRALELPGQNVPAAHLSVMAVDIKGLQQAHEDGLTAGVVHANGALRTRLEIDEFIKQKDMANLYILALINLQKMESWRDRFSWFQIAGEHLQARNGAAKIGLTSTGIHGKPFVPWDNVHPDKTTIIWDYLDRDPEGRPRFQPNHTSGYCSHSSNLFPTWHRKLAP